MFMKNMADGYASYSHLCADSGGSSVDHSLPSYEQVVSQESNRRTLSGSSTGANNKHLAANISQVDYVTSSNEHPSVAVTQSYGSHQVQLMTNYDGTFQSRKEPNMIFMYILVFVSISTLTWAYVYYILKT